MKEPNKDINWINAAKALCIFMVYFDHCKVNAGVSLHGWDSPLYAIYINTFLMVSGYLLFRKQLSEPIMSQSRTMFCGRGGGKYLLINILSKIVLPTILFAFLNYFPKMIVRGGDISFGDLLMTTLGGCTLWFTSALAVAEILLLVLLITRCRNLWVYFGISVVFAIAGSWLAANEVEILGNSHFPWWYKNGLIATLFLTTGGLYWKYEQKLQKLLRPAVTLILGVLFLVLLYLVKGNYKSMVSICSINAQGYLVSVLGVVVFLQICRRIPRSRFLTFVGRNSLGFFLICGIVGPMGMAISRFITTAPFLHFALNFTISLMFVSIFVFLTTKYIPFIYDFKKLKLYGKES